MTTDEAGVPRIVGTPLKVIEIDLDRLHMIDWHMNGQRMKSVGNIPV